VAGFAPDTAYAKDKGCPPGLAKKSPACVPPGLAKKGVKRDGYTEIRRDDRDRYHDRDDDYVYGDWRRGDRLPRDRYVILDEGDRVIFDGREYIVVDTDNGTVLRRGDDWYRLPRYDNGEYVRVGDSILRVDRETRQVIDLVRLADLILN
ncbi:MAG: hypothetical protein HKM96_08770, partial [Boseongicola sp.]|nr:hypothetical protein [Boseongicola sp.]